MDARKLPSSSSPYRDPARFRPRRGSGNPPGYSRIRSGAAASNFSRRRVDPRHKPKNEEYKVDTHGEDPADVSFIVGTCPDMCPERERANRERLRDLAVFERLNGNPVKTSKDLAVKKFCRTLSAMDVEASDIRPLSVLEETLIHLLNLLDSREHPFEVVHDFIFDRTRSIRQDLSMQNIANERAIYLYEKMVKFHVTSHHRLRRCSGSSISSMQHLNMEQLVKALTSLYNLYDANRKTDYIYENEAEYRSLYVLLHLDPGSRSMGEPLSLWFRNLTFALVKSKEICFARKILRLFRMGNYKDFLCTIVSEATYLQLCVMEHYIDEMRSSAVQYINSVGYKLQPYPLLRLSELLMMKVYTRSRTLNLYAMRVVSRHLLTLTG
ncbi:PREDICTED: SAC3 family protein C isoform X2 [Tarenaya hassleriana]|uniref:SAC3 family protein C isoform X2 n=1 Tax=Tarenaya hassleriana TaxID=28532 RepID=UPI0008FD4883|nr:PREDICTED: SAC3 family protein C isoform X2 [Tarenaya hassleriana]